MAKKQHFPVYEEKNGSITKDGHTMFIQDVIVDLNRKSFLENKRIELLKIISDGLEDDIEKLITSLPSHLLVAHNEKANSDDKFRIYNIATNKFIESGSDSVKELLINAIAETK